LGGSYWVTVREKRRLRAFQDMMLRRIFGSKEEEVAGVWRKLHNEELNPYPANVEISLGT
jgi:hypothetical protein